MANMSYCRMENTFHDLQDCEQHFLDDLSESETTYRNQILELAKRIAEKYEVDEDNELKFI